MGFRLLLLAGLAAAGLTLSGVIAQADELKLHTDPDLWKMVTAIAPSAASLEVAGGIGTKERAMTIGRDASGQTVVTSVQVLAKGAAPQVTPGTLVLMIVHAPGECATPYEMDDVNAAKGIETFVVNAAGNEIWEVAKIDDGVSVRRVQGVAGVGAWERFKKSPSDYTAYRCQR